MSPVTMFIPGFGYFEPVVDAITRSWSRTQDGVHVLIEHSVGFRVIVALPDSDLVVSGKPKPTALDALTVMHKELFDNYMQKAARALKHLVVLPDVLVVPGYGDFHKLDTSGWPDAEDVWVRDFGDGVSLRITRYEFGDGTVEWQPVVYAGKNECYYSALENQMYDSPEEAFTDVLGIIRKRKVPIDKILAHVEPYGR